MRAALVLRAQAAALRAEAEARAATLEQVADGLESAGSVDLISRKNCGSCGLSEGAWTTHAGKSFPAHRAGRMVVAHRSDVMTWIASRPVRRSSPAAEAPDPADPNAATVARFRRTA